jgi:putative endonuclease
LAAARSRWWPERSLGQRGERLAERYLRRLGYCVVARRARDRLGELDLVAVDGRTVVFVEVKTRRAGEPAAAVDARKQARLTRAALSFLQRHELLDCPSRFDVVAIEWPERGQPTVRHYRSAFDATGPGGQMFA